MTNELIDVVETTYATSERFVMYRHTTEQGPGHELIDLKAVSAVGWQPATSATEPYVYLQLGERRRRFYFESNVAAQEEFERMALLWTLILEGHDFGETVLHDYERVV